MKPNFTTEELKKYNIVFAFDIGFAWEKGVPPELAKELSKYADHLKQVADAAIEAQLQLDGLKPNQYRECSGSNGTITSDSGWTKPQIIAEIN